MNITRIRQVIKYGWQHAGQVSNQSLGGRKRMKVFLDILTCYICFGMWSNQYVKEKFWQLEKSLRSEIGARYLAKNKIHEEWVKDFYSNRAFLAKWRRYELESTPRKRERRNVAYSKRYGMGQGCLVEYGVELSRQHFLEGSISIGSNVLLGKNVFIDYSGKVTIKDNVRITNGVIIETHQHTNHSDPSVARSVVVPTELVIEEGAMIGSRAIILPSCHYIGRNSRVGAGAVVTKDVPDFSVVVGVPAKVIKEVNH